MTDSPRTMRINRPNPPPMSFRSTRIPRSHRHAPNQPARPDRPNVLQEEGDAPERVLPGNRDRERDQPDADGDPEHHDEPTGDRPRDLEVAVDAHVEREQDQAHGDVRDHEG